MSPYSRSTWVRTLDIKVRGVQMRRAAAAGWKVNPSCPDCSGSAMHSKFKRFAVDSASGQVVDY